jgi:hypothetical protein
VLFPVCRAPVTTTVGMTRRRSEAARKGTTSDSHAKRRDLGLAVQLGQPSLEPGLQAGGGATRASCELSAVCSSACVIQAHSRYQR